MSKDFVIQYISLHQNEFIKALEEGGEVVMDISEVQNIDLAGLQLLIALVKEISRISGTLIIEGNCTEGFQCAFDKISSTRGVVCCGPDLKKFLYDIGEINE